MNLRPALAHPLLACALGSGATLAQAVTPTYAPLAVTGYDQDVIAETMPAIANTTMALDGSDYVLYSAAYGALFPTGRGLPDNGTIASATRAYQLQSAASANAIVLAATDSRTLTLATPASFSSLSLLGFSTEGSSTASVTLHFVDAQSTTLMTGNVPDWFNSAGAVIAGFDRTGRSSNSPDYDATNPRMYPLDVALSCADQARQVSAITVANTTAPNTTTRVAVFAVAGANDSTVAPVSGGSWVRVGGTLPLADATAGGTWSSADPFTASVDANGVVTGVASGNVSVDYSVVFPCGTVVQSRALRVVVADTIFPDGFDPD